VRVLTVAVLISGTGSNLRALLDAAAEPGFPARVVVVGADRQADGFAHAEAFGIPTVIVPFREFETREQWGAELRRRSTCGRPTSSC
jgi:phosphoribosylglycinamide formyltransferase-1